jgi:hypothetical protein
LQHESSEIKKNKNRKVSLPRATYMGWNFSWLCLIKRNYMLPHSSPESCGKFWSNDWWKNLSFNGELNSPIQFMELANHKNPFLLIFIETWLGGLNASGFIQSTAAGINTIVMYVLTHLLICTTNFSASKWLY